MSLNTISVRVANPNPVRVGAVSYDNVINVKVNDQQDYKVKTANFSVNKLANLSDVYAQNPTDGDVLIYNSATQKYETDKITQDQINITNIDAGIF
jgi:hypothetical protein